MRHLTSIVLILLIIPLVTFGQRRNKKGNETPKRDLSELYAGLKWRNIGPFRGGRSVASIGVVSDPFTFYMGGTGSGIWKTTDAGVSWKNISDGQLKTGTVGAIAVAESDPNVIYIGMGEQADRGDPLPIVGVISRPIVGIAGTKYSLSITLLVLQDSRWT